MTRIITMEDIQNHFTMTDCISELEVMFEEMGKEQAITGSREDIYTPVSEPPENTVDPVYYDLKTMGGVIPELGVGAVRINSYLFHWPIKSGNRTREKVPAADDRLVGLVLVFDSNTGEPLVIFPDRIPQSYRVAGTSALGAKYLSRKNATILGILGSGWQARSHLVALDAIRNLEKVKVYSPTRENLEEYVQEMGDKVRPDLVAVDQPEEVFENADIIQTTTNSLSPVFDLDWIEPGMHIGILRDVEAPKEFFNPNDYESFVQSWSKIEALEELGNYHLNKRNLPTKNVNNHVVEGEESVPKFDNRNVENKPLCDWSKVPGLGEVMVNESTGRSTPEGVTVFYNRGMGIQFAAVGKVLYDLAKEKDLGHIVPTELLTEERRPEIFR